ncbi:MAG: cyclase family protein [Chloroflexia bacterium]|nr:cyclase family protein [Chloroflexia bacterium]
MPRPGEIMDVTVFMQPGMPQWAGEAVMATRSLSELPGDEANVAMLTMTTHTGTHVDAPRHFFERSKTLDQIPLDRWVGPCVVADFTGVTTDITADDLDRANIPPNITRLVLKTRNSELWRTHPETFVEDFIAVAPSGARWLVERLIRLVAIDYLSIGSFGPEGVETHRILLGNDVLVVEGLNLTGVPAGAYELLCFPLNLFGLDGAPARVALRVLGV